MVSTTRKILIAFGILTFGLVAAQNMHIMTYNIKYANQNDGPYNWSNRKSALAAQINFYQPDIMGLQEVLLEQCDYLLEELEIYNSIGVGREDGINSGEFSPIFYKPEIFTLLDSGTFWLAENPEKPTKGWDAAFSRICTYGRFSIKNNKKEFWVFNTHFDHVGVSARKNSLTLIQQKIHDLNTDNLPFIIMGDLNLNDESEEIKTFQNQMKLVYPDFIDTYEVNHFGWRGTYNGYTFSNEYPRIDYIFSKGMQVKKHTTITDRQSNGLWYSDHFAVWCELEIE